MLNKWMYLLLLSTITISTKAESEPSRLLSTFQITLTKGDDVDENVEVDFGVDVYDSYSSFGTLVGSKNYDLKFSSKSKSAVIGLSYNQSYLKFRFRNGGREFFSTFCVFLVDKGDKFTININKSGVSFSGNEGYKMALQYRLFSIANSLRKPLKVRNPERFFEMECLLIDNELNLQFETLQAAQKKIPSEMIVYLKNQCIGLAAYRKLKALSSSKVMGANMIAKALEFYRSELYTRLPIVDDSMHRSTFMIDFIYEKLKYEYLGRSTGGEKKIDPNKFLDRVYREFHGGILGKLLFISYSNLPAYSQGENIYRSIDTALDKVEDKVYNRLLSQLKEANVVGTSAFNFELPDTSGNKITLKSLSGKIVLIDFWFSGCRPCMKVNDMMVKVIEGYSGDDLVVVSINIDKDESMWKRSVLSGQYTHDSYINLNTEGLGGRHPLVNHYSVRAVPQVILIDRDGKIISTNAPVPLDEKRILQLRDMIDRHM